MTKTSKNSVGRRSNSDGSRKTAAPPANVGIGSEAITKSLKKMRRRYGTTLKRLAK